MNKFYALSLSFALWLLGIFPGGSLVDAGFENLIFYVRGRWSREAVFGGGWRAADVGRIGITLGLRGPCSHVAWTQ